MAIVFDKTISESNLLNSHNNNVIEFHSDNILTAVKCTLDFGSASFEITPNPAGQFEYNMKHATAELLNPNNFRDEVLPDIQASGYVYPDNTLYKLIALIYTITFDNETTETTTKNYRFTKSAKQPWRYDETIIDSTDVIGLLIPFAEYSAKSYAATYYAGYPFDIPVYCAINETVTIKNKTNNLEYNFVFTQGVSRLFFSDGTVNFSFDDVLPLVYGENELEFWTGGVARVTLLLTKKVSGCGPYLKYYSAWGGYGYWLFDEVLTKDRKTKIASALESDFTSIEEATDLDRITGKDSADLVNMFTEYLSPKEMDYLAPIVDSARVDMYTREVYTQARVDSWRGVIIQDSTQRIDATKKSLKQLQLTVGYTNKTLML